MWEYYQILAPLEHDCAVMRHSEKGFLRVRLDHGGLMEQASKFTSHASPAPYCNVRLDHEHRHCTAVELEMGIKNQFLILC